MRFPLLVVVSPCFSTVSLFGSSSGASQDQDHQKGRQGHHREVLHPSGQWLPHQQEGVWGDRHHPQQASAEQNCRVSRIVLQKHAPLLAAVGLNRWSNHFNWLVQNKRLRLFVPGWFTFASWPQIWWWPDRVVLQQDKPGSEETEESCSMMDHSGVDLSTCFVTEACAYFLKDIRLVVLSIIKRWAVKTLCNLCSEVLK